MIWVILFFLLMIVLFLVVEYLIPTRVDKNKVNYEKENQGSVDRKIEFENRIREQINRR